MVGQISTTLADSGLNIQEMMNKHQDDIAYNIIDVSGEPDAALIQKLKEIEGVVMVRHINPEE